MLRLPPSLVVFILPILPELTALVHKFTHHNSKTRTARARACLVPHADMFIRATSRAPCLPRVTLPRRILILEYGISRENRRPSSRAGVADAARDAPIDEALAGANCKRRARCCTRIALRTVSEHSLEVQLPFLRVLVPDFTFVPVALERCVSKTWFVLASDCAASSNSERRRSPAGNIRLEYYEDDATTRIKDRKGHRPIAARDARGLYDTCRKRSISMCGLGPAVAMLTALDALGANKRLGEIRHVCGRVRRSRRRRRIWG